MNYFLYPYYYYCIGLIPMDVFCIYIILNFGPIFFLLLFLLIVQWVTFYHLRQFVKQNNLMLIFKQS